MRDTRPPASVLLILVGFAGLGQRCDSVSGATFDATRRSLRLSPQVAEIPPAKVARKLNKAG